MAKHNDYDYDPPMFCKDALEIWEDRQISHLTAAVDLLLWNGNSWEVIINSQRVRNLLAWSSEEAHVRHTRGTCIMAFIPRAHPCWVPTRRRAAVMAARAKLRAV